MGKKKMLFPWSIGLHDKVSAWHEWHDWEISHCLQNTIYHEKQKLIFTREKGEMANGLHLGKTEHHMIWAHLSVVNMDALS